MKRFIGYILTTLFIGVVPAQDLTSDLQSTPASSFVHSLSVDMSCAPSFAPHEYGVSGPVIIKPKTTFDHELGINYSCIHKNGLGFSLSIFMGSYSRSFDLAIVENDALPIDIGSPYVGIMPQFTYCKPISPIADIQVNCGIKIRPFYYKPDHWCGGEILYHNTIYSFNDDFLEVPYRNYYIPDLAGAFLFNIHKKNGKSNFQIGIFANLSFVKRMIIHYETTEFKGNVGWTSSSIGLKIGYTFKGLKP